MKVWVKVVDKSALENAIGELNVSDEVKQCLISIGTEVREAYEERLESMRCANCKHWTVPTWDTQGMGTCYLNSHLRDNKQLRVLSVQNGEWITTHETFGCIKFEKKISGEG